MNKLFAIVGLIVTAFCLVLATANFARLESRTVAPSLGELAGYVGVPSFVGIAALIGLGVYFVPMINGNDRRPPSSPPTLYPSVNPTPFTPSESDRLDPYRTADNPDPSNAARLHVWNIIDELSDALRADDEASEALFVVRERYHRLQFGRPEALPA